jgi:hypothetical protein
MNQEIDNKFLSLDIVTVIQVGGLKWLWDGVIMNGEGTVKNFMKRYTRRKENKR